MGGWVGGREEEKFEDKSTSSHADLEKHCAPSHPHWHPYGRNNIRKEVNKEVGRKFAFTYLRGVVLGGGGGGRQMEVKVVNACVI